MWDDVMCVLVGFGDCVVVDNDEVEVVIEYGACVM